MNFTSGLFSTVKQFCLYNKLAYFLPRPIVDPGGGLPHTRTSTLVLAHRIFIKLHVSDCCPCVHLKINLSGVKWVLGREVECVTVTCSTLIKNLNATIHWLGTKRVSKNILLRLRKWQP